MTLFFFFFLADLVKSCQDVKAMNPAAEDGEFWLTLQDGQKALVYCSPMSGAPKEFISLPAGPQKNFAVYYHAWADRGGNTFYKKVGIDLIVSF